MNMYERIGLEEENEKPRIYFPKLYLKKYRELSIGQSRRVLVPIDGLITSHTPQFFHS